MNKDNKFSKELIEILSKSVDREIYGSVEVFFEKGRITQITQRIINKVRHIQNKENSDSTISSTSIS
jgi:hypothetical protein